MVIKLVIIFLLIAGALIIVSIYFYQGKKAKGDEISKSVDNFLNRPVHKDLTREILSSIENDKLEQTIFDNIEQLIAQAKKDELQTVEELSPGQKAIYSTWLVEGEVNNGGFNQFYFNSSGKYSIVAVEGFKLIGALQYSELMEKANATYFANKNKLDKFNDGTLESFSKSYKDNPLNELDTIFYKLYDEENLSQLKIKYITNHLEEFIQE